MAARRPVRRPTSTPPSSEGPSWVLLELNDASSRVWDIAEGTSRLPSGAVIERVGGQVQVQPGAAAAQVNDVEVRGRASLRLGDVITEGGHTYLVLPGLSSASPRPGELDHGMFLARATEEIQARSEAFGLLVGRSGAFTRERFSSFLSRATAERPTSANRRIFASLGRDLVEVLVTNASQAGIESVRDELSAAAGTLGEAVRWGSALFPRDGASAQELWAAAVDRLLDLPPLHGGEVPWADPCMTRIWSLAERWARRSNAIVLLGEEGVGRETLVRGIRRLGAPQAPFIVHRDAGFDLARWSEDVARASGGALHVRHPEPFPEREWAAFLAATRFRPSANIGSREGLGSELADLIVVPSLQDRRADVEPIAEYVLHAVDARLARRRSSLRTDVRSVLQARTALENVRGLRNAVILAALSMEGAELREEHFATRASLDSMPTVERVRDHLRETERRALQDALHRTGWNVSEAARLMDLPRRTLVYRMAKLAVRRPSR
jgi:Bacterial regulatory protein, Fis family